MPHQLQETDFSFSSLELGTPSTEYLLTPVSDSDPKKHHDFLALNLTRNSNKNLEEISKNCFHSHSQVMAKKPLTPKPRRKSCYYHKPSSIQFC